MTTLALLALFGVSFVAAAINAVAGGGTFLTFPVLMMNGVSSLQANIMSTIALWPGGLASSYGYKNERDMDKKQLYPLLFVGVVGGVCGATLLLLTPERVFSVMVPWLLCIATLIFTFGNRIILFMRKEGSHNKKRWPVYLCMSVIAIYGGYFGAGIGILTLAMLQLMGMSNIHRMNALKTVLTSAINAVTAVIFMFSGKVVWGVAGVMIAGGISGGYVGARLALKVSPQKVRSLVIVIGFAMTAYFFVYGA